MGGYVGYEIISFQIRWMFNEIRKFFDRIGHSSRMIPGTKRNSSIRETTMYRSSRTKESEDTESLDLSIHFVKNSNNSIHTRYVSSMFTMEINISIGDFRWILGRRIHYLFSFLFLSTSSWYVDKIYIGWNVGFYFSRVWPQEIRCVCD